MSVNTKMTALADEIRTLSSTTEKIGLDEMASHVGEANMEITEQANLISQITTLVQQKTTPPSTDTNDATAGAGDILSGKTAYANGRKITGTIASKAAATYTPSASNQTIASGQYLSGAQTIKGDSNLKAENIKSGTSIFGITGTYEGSSSGGGSENTDICNITIKSDYTIAGIGYYSSSGHTVWNGGMSHGTISAICGSVVYIIQDGHYSATATAGEILSSSYGDGLTYRVPNTPQDITINITTD